MSKITWSGERGVYDGNRKVRLSKRYIAALKELAAAQNEMLAAQRGFFPECWWGSKVTVYDLSDAVNLSIESGPKSEPPSKRGRFVVEVKHTRLTAPPLRGPGHWAARYGLRSSRERHYASSRNRAIR